MGETVKKSHEEIGNESGQFDIKNFRITDNEDERNTITENRGSDNGSGGTTHRETELKPSKKPRGRPKGSKNKDTTTVILQDEEIKYSKDKSAGLDDESNSAKYTHTRKKINKFMTPDEAQASSAFILGIANDLAIQVMGSDAGMNLLEGSLISISLPEYLSTLEISTIEKTKSIAYPVMLLGGVSMWGLRLLAIMNEKRKEANKENKRQQEINNQQPQDTKTNSNSNTTNQEGSDINWKQRQFNPIDYLNPI